MAACTPTLLKILSNCEIDFQSQIQIEIFQRGTFPMANAKLVRSDAKWSRIDTNKVVYLSHPSKNIEIRRWKELGTQWAPVQELTKLLLEKVSIAVDHFES